jgi:hypothetical protein
MVDLLGRMRKVLREMGGMLMMSLITEVTVSWDF